MSYIIEFKNNGGFLKFFLCLVFIVLLNSCATLNYNYQIPEKTNDGIETGTLASEKIDSTKLIQLSKDILENKYINMHSLLISKNSKLVFEKYFNGYNKNRTHFLASAGKSIASALVGIAIDNGFLKSSDQKLFDIFDFYPVIKNYNQKKERIKLKHLLTMTAGFDCGSIMDYQNHCGAKMRVKTDPIKYILDLPMQHEPGEIFNYNDGTPEVLAAALVHSAKMNYFDFQKKHLFDPLGIPHRPDSIGITSRDMLKLGLLYMNKGLWKGNRIVSEDWVNESTKPHVQSTFSKYAKYGYLWWVTKFEQKGKTYDSFYAAGNGGQYIFVIPKLEVVVVFTGGNYNNLTESRRVFEMMNDYILPAINN